MSVRKMAMQSIYALAYLDFTRGSDFALEQELNERAKDPEFLPIIIKSFPKVELTYNRRVDIEHIFSLQSRIAAPRFTPPNVLQQFCADF